MAAAEAHMNPALVVLHPRRIPEAIDALNHLPVPQCRIVGLTERGVADVWPQVLEDAHKRRITHLCVVSDDAVVTQHALTSVLRAAVHGVVTGWCNLDESDNRVNLSDKPLTNRVPSEQAYALPTVWDVIAGPSLRRTWFTGMCLTTATLAVWEQYPFEPYGSPGYASDYHMSLRLQDDDVRVTAVREGFVRHLKRTWNQHDPRWELRLTGEGIVWRD